jgi:hypothetical protein
MPSITFVICTEQGLLEPMSVVLVRSLRRFGGAFREAPVLSYQPRPGYEIAPKTLHALRQLGVTHLTEPLNEKHAHYPQGNKPPVCAHAERTVSTEFIVFLDSDTVVLNEPRALLLPASYDIGLRPSDKVGVATSGPTDRNYAYWHQLYQLLSVDPSLVGRVATTVDQQTIYAYYNSGVMSVRREAGIFRQWNDNYERVMTSRLKPRQGVFHTDQTTLAATLTQQQSAVEILPPTYNYPFHLHHNVPLATRIESLGQAPLLHYHKALHYPAGESTLMSLAGDEQREWLEEQIAYLRTVMPSTLPKQGPLKRLMGRLSAWLR